MLFNRKDLATQLLAQADVPDRLAVRKPTGMLARSFIGLNAAIVGDLRSDGALQVDGHICGNVQCAQLVVGRDAAITGAVTAEQVVVCGRITGTIRARLVILQDTARVESDIVYSLLAVDEGARFEGVAHCRPDPLQDEDASSALADLKRMMAGHRAGKAPCATEGNGRHPRTEQPPNSLDAPSGKRSPSKPGPDVGSGDRRLTDR